MKHKKYLVPTMLADIIYSAVAGMDGRRFEDLTSCPYCGGGELKGYDFRKKHFASIVVEGKPGNVNVYVKRFHCSRCGSLCYANEPFYPDTRLGKPVVDLCVTLSTRLPYHRTARVLRQMGIIVDRGTVRNYTNRPFGTIPCTEIYGFRIPVSILDLSFSIFAGNELRPVKRAENNPS